ncbi:uncharacterized protein An16g04590 [Aspergillus niger]|uniref:Contig An16c0170, genomic contig n=2 Tax=Aspergillus niger TaxID=5061 RepID=A2R7S8_ASPNC|nr:uncharacterized protein An16g04590 [Aspergillus niger]CAK42889.1 unnamed protein product [Aspergillus niger]
MGVWSRRYHQLGRGSSEIESKSCFSNGSFTLSALWPVHSHNSLFPFCFIFEEMFKAYPIMLVFGFASGSTRSGLCASSCLCLS